MFNKDSLLYSVNSITKTLGIIIFVSSIIFTKSTILLLIISIVLTLTVEKSKHIAAFGYLSVFIGIISLFYPPLMWINKIITCIIYIAFLIHIIDMHQLKYLFDLAFYPFKSRALTKTYIFIVYGFKSLKGNYIRFNKIKKSYGLANNIDFFKAVFLPILITTKNDLQEIEVVHKIRFYNIEKKRTFVEDQKIEPWDVTYLLVHIVFLIFSIILGR